MRYLCLMYDNSDSSARRAGQPLACAAVEFDEELRRTGHHVASGALEGTGAATTVRVRRDVVSVLACEESDAGTQLGGFVLIEAKDLNDAIRLASQFPCVGNAHVDVHRIIESRKIHP